MYTCTCEALIKGRSDQRHKGNDYVCMYIWSPINGRRGISMYTFTYGALINGKRRLLCTDSYTMYICTHGAPIKGRIICHESEELFYSSIHPMLVNYN